MVTHFLSKEKDYDCSDVLNGLVTRSKFLKHVDKEFGESWFDEFKQSKWLPLLKQIRWIERKRKVGQSDFTVKRSVGRGAVSSLRSIAFANFMRLMHPHSLVSSQL